VPTIHKQLEERHLLPPIVPYLVQLIIIMLVQVQIIIIMLP
jgi:hypothetical protein